MAGETIDLEYIISPDNMAVQIADQWRLNDCYSYR